MRERRRQKCDEKTKISIVANFVCSFNGSTAAIVSCNPIMPSPLWAQQEEYSHKEDASWAQTWSILRRNESLQEEKRLSWIYGNVSWLLKNKIDSVKSTLPWRSFWAVRVTEAQFFWPVRTSEQPQPHGILFQGMNGGEKWKEWIEWKQKMIESW